MNIKAVGIAVAGIDVGLCAQLSRRCAGRIWVLLPALSNATLVTCPVRRSQIVSRVRDAANILSENRVVGQMPLKLHLVHSAGAVGVYDLFLVGG
ncbi:hypothetical protein [Rhizobium leguminosarum]|uniref:hypothetical protein n=1 Tax=Rhizobium leguminosarum TaxID=384 RepID=UPI000482A15C|nr:hypothetical protein [Rhizobium leguminosarum]